MFNNANQIIHDWKQQLLIWLGSFAIAAFSLWVFFQIAGRVVAEKTTEFDTEILLKIYELHTPQLNQIMAGITFLGNGSTIIYLCGLTFVLLLVQRRFSNALTLVIVAGGAIKLNIWLKALFARIRPSLWERIVEANSFSFPSGHAMVSLAIYGFLGYLLIVNFRRSGIIFILTTLLILAIGFSRVYLGVHWPTDVIAGYAAGLVWLISCIISLNILQLMFRKDNQQNINY